jgi:hypothetical protein
MKKVFALPLIIAAISTTAFAQKADPAKVIISAKEIKTVQEVKTSAAIDFSINPALFAIKPEAKPKMCIDKIYERTTTVTESRPGVAVAPLTGQTRFFWPNGSIIRVKFLGGSTIVKFKIIQYANEWSRYVNIRFRFVSEGDAEIKIGFNAGGSWSMVGTNVKDNDALVALGELFGGERATMNYGWFTDATADEEFRRVIMHEFGHALGFVHEHSHPEAGIPWDREAAYIAYGNSQHWSRAQVDANVFARYDRNQTQFSNYDRTSIMHYPVDNALTIGDFEVGWNTMLSQTDKDFSAIIYPKANARVNKLLVTFKTGGDDLRVNSQAKLIIELNSGAVTKIEISANGGQPYGGGSTNTALINLPPGINLSNLVKCSLYFESGKQFEWDSPDNWNIDEVRLEWLELDRPNVLLSTVTGTPLIRMSNQSNLLLFPR